MPRYYSIFDDEIVIDEQGIELADADSARQAAMAGARALAADQVTDGRLYLDHRIEVADEGGAALLTVTFEDAVAVTR